MRLKQTFIHWWHILVDALADDRYESHMPQGTASDRIADHWHRVGCHLDKAINEAKCTAHDDAERSKVADTAGEPKSD